MSVNGVEIEVGQRWRRRDGSERVIEKFVPQRWYVWEDERGCTYTEDGMICYGHPEHSKNLVELVATGDSTQATTFGTLQERVAVLAADIVGTLPDAGRTNPKDLIGDKKLALHLLSPIAEAHWVVGQYAGMLKYGAWNWREAGVRASVYISAARRHLAAYLSGEEFDPTDGSHHLGNVMACCAILLEAREIGKLTDDRPPCFSHRPTYVWAEDRMAQLKVQYSDKSPKHYSIADRPPAVERMKADDTEGGAQ